MSCALHITGPCPIKDVQRHSRPSRYIIVSLTHNIVVIHASFSHQVKMESGGFLRLKVLFIIHTVVILWLNEKYASCTVKSRAVYRSTIQFLTIFGVLLSETCY